MSEVVAGAKSSQFPAFLTPAAALQVTLVNGGVYTWGAKTYLGSYS
jgi:hypothetical protein